MDFPPVPLLFVMSPPWNGKWKKCERSCNPAPREQIQSPYLTHEVWYDPVKDGVLKAEAFLAGAEGSEVLSSLGNNVGEKLYGDGAQRLAVNSYFEEHLWVGLPRVLLDSGHLW